MTREEERRWRIQDVLDEFYGDSQQESREKATKDLLSDLYFYVAQTGLDKEHIKDVAELEALP